MSESTHAENLPENEQEKIIELAREHAQAAGEPSRLEVLEGENAKLRDQLLRAVAETENVRKRAERDREETSKYAISKFAGDMVSVLENLKRASESISPEARAASEQLANLGAGVDLTLQELLSTFERYGIVRVDPMGQKFDHNLHQAVAQVERTDVENGTVIQVVQAGYVIADRLLRPAMVAVSKAPSDVKKVDTTA
jgi:molecular chaperone GrpE